MADMEYNGRILKGGDYILAQRYNSTDLSIILGKVESTDGSMATIKGHEIVPRPDSFSAKYLGYPAHYDMLYVLTDRLDYRTFNGRVPIDENMVVIDDEKYEMLKGWLDEGMHELFSRYYGKCNKYELRDIIREKLNNTKSPYIYELLKKLDLADDIVGTK